MKGLLVLTEPPLPFGGAASRWNFVLATELLRRGTALTILSCSGGTERDTEAARQFGPELNIRFFQPIQRRGLRRLLSKVYPVSHLFSEQMRRTLYSLQPQHFDFVQFETHFAGWLANRPIDKAVMNVHSLYAIDHQDQNGGVRERWESKSLMRAERQVLGRFRRLSALTPRLAARLRVLAPKAQVAVCPMSIDLSLYPADLRPARKPGSVRIGMIGSFHWAPTRSACYALSERIWPRVRQQLDSPRLMLVGRRAAEFCRPWANDCDVEVHSDVADTQHFFHQLDVMVYLPAVGSGMKVKVLESIALETPVVTNEEGCEGLPDEISEIIGVADDNAAVARIAWLVQNPTAAGEQARHLRSILARELSPPTCVDRTLAFACEGNLS